MNFKMAQFQLPEECIEIINITTQFPTKRRKLARIIKLPHISPNTDWYIPSHLQEIQEENRNTLRCWEMWSIKNSELKR